jgi:tryptophan synthase alpha chain
MNGIRHISAVFDRIQPRAAFMPYFTLGFPSISSSFAIVEAMASSGADLIELGIPFSDPLADGPTIQRSTQIALEKGIDVSKCLELTAQLRERGVKQPLLLMGYVNPILAYGLERFVTDAKNAGVDGFIIPDLPVEEAGKMEAECLQQDRALIHMLAPTSTEKRIAQVAAHSRSFIYLVSLSGTTGARPSLSGSLKSTVDRVRAFTSLPLAVGFGISRPEHVRAVANIADGVIVGSSIIDAVSQVPEHEAPGAAAGIVERFRRALDTGMDEEVGQI